MEKFYFLSPAITFDIQQWKRGDRLGKISFTTNSFYVFMAFNFSFFLGLKALLRTGKDRKIAPFNITTIY